MVVQHNCSAINALNKLNTNVVKSNKSSEKLSSGLRINKSADNAAGLAISEKMRSQIRGLSQSVRNSNDGISLIQTAEGGLEEVHAILRRVRELSAQAANDTYTSEDREHVQSEVDALRKEIDRIAESTNYNGIKLLDGSTAGGTNNSSEYGERYGMREYNSDFGQYVNVISDIAGVAVNFTTGASGIGGENATWDSTGKELTINLAKGSTYTDTQINALIKNAKFEKENIAAPASVTWQSDSGVITAASTKVSATVSGVRQDIALDLLPLISGGKAIEGHADTIRLTANQYGSHANTEGLFSAITIATDSAAGQEKVSIDAPADRTASGGRGPEITLHLATGVGYSNSDIENLLSKAGFDYTVDIFSKASPDGDTVAYFNKVGTAFNSFGYSSSGSSSMIQVTPSEGSLDDINIVTLDSIAASPTPQGAPNSWTNVTKADGSGGAKDLTKIRDYIANIAAPNAVEAILGSFGSINSLISGSTIGIGLNIDDISNGTGLTLANVTFLVNPNDNTIRLTLNIDQTWIHNKTNAQGEFASKDDEYDLLNTIAHEMMHAVMAVTNGNGMKSSGDRFPLWFIEGMAQTMSGDDLWVDGPSAAGALGLSATSGDTDIKNALTAHELSDSTDNASNYGTGYLACMYLGWMAAGGGTVSGDKIASGLNIIMGKIAGGDSLDAAIKEHTKYDGLSDFESGFQNDTGAYQFIRDLLAATGSGAGSILAGSLSAPVAIGAGTPNGEPFLKVYPNSENVVNKFPDDKTVNSGGSATGQGKSVNNVYEPEIAFIGGPGRNGRGIGLNVFKEGGRGLILQIGANNDEHNKLTISISAMDSSAIGVATINVLTGKEARMSMEKVDGAIKAVSQQRAYLGAMQNRLEHTVNNLMNTEENLTAAESQIRDADMAAEMIEYTKYGILQQAAQSMLAQVNQSQQAILQLLG